MKRMLISLITITLISCNSNPPKSVEQEDQREKIRQEILDSLNKAQQSQHLQDEKEKAEKEKIKSDECNREISELNTLLQGMTRGSVPIGKCDEIGITSNFYGDGSITVAYSDITAINNTILKINNTRDIALYAYGKNLLFISTDLSDGRANSLIEYIRDIARCKHNKEIPVKTFTKSIY